MNPLLQSLVINKDLSVPVYLQVANGIIAHIRKGRIPRETALPPSRVLADTLQVHRKTIVAAYEELNAQGWVNNYPRKGVFVARELPEIKTRGVMQTASCHQLAEETAFEVHERAPVSRTCYKGDMQRLVLTDGMPDTRLLPMNLVVREYRRFATYRFTHKYLGYSPPEGSENLRRELAVFLSETRGLNITKEDVIITKGAQMALYLSGQVLLKRNEVVITADPGYADAREIFEVCGGRVETVPVDEQGISVDAIEAICREKKVKMVYIIPHHHYPTTATLCPERRIRLLELARKYRFAIIEDDYDFDFHYASSPILPLAGIDDNGSVIYIGSFGKLLAPGIRIGFMVAPRNLLAQAVRLRKLIDRQGEHLLEEAIANLLKNGDIGRHLKKMNKVYRERRDLLCMLLQKHLKEFLTFKVPDGGFAIWVTYAAGIHAEAVAAEAHKMGLTIADGTYYYVDKERFPDQIRLGYACLNAEEMKEAVQILKKAILKSLKLK